VRRRLKCTRLVELTEEDLLKNSRFLEKKKEKNEEGNLDHTGRTLFGDMEGLADGWRRVKD